MNSKYAVALSIVALFAAGQAALASNSGGNFDVKDGFGEELGMRHGWFGTKQTLVKDRLGDQMYSKKGLFGTKDSQVNVFGNGYRKHKGLLSGTEVQGQDIFGDKLYSKKSWFGMGRRQTNVDVSGVSSIAQQFIGKHFSLGNKLPGMPGVPGMGMRPGEQPPLDPA
ncbi:MAG: hypothetical protein ACREMY_27670, partial [bacterium]